MRRLFGAILGLLLAQCSPVYSYDDAVIPPAMPYEARQSGDAVAATCNPCVIDVLVAYPPSLTAMLQGQALQNYITEAFTLSNQVWANNELPIVLRLVGTVATSYVPIGNATDLGRVITPDDGYADDILVARDSMGADVMILLSTNHNYPGQAYLMPPGGNEISAAGIVRTDAWLQPYVLVHEIGHIMGLTHDTDAATYTSRGYRDPENEFYTIMVWGNPQPGTIPYFSSDTRTYLGQPLGDATHNSEAALRVNAPIVSAYRVSTTPGC